MISERVVDELASRCLALIVFDQHGRRDRPSDPGVRAELRAVALEVEQGGLSATVIVEKVLSGLLDRYEPEQARRLHQKFLAAFSIEVTLGFANPARSSEESSKEHPDVPGFSIKPAER